jgi:hypothetical protein
MPAADRSVTERFDVHRRTRSRRSFRKARAERREILVDFLDRENLAASRVMPTFTLGDVNPTLM